MTLTNIEELKKVCVLCVFRRVSFDNFRALSPTKSLKLHIYNIRKLYSIVVKDTSF